MDPIYHESHFRMHFHIYFEYNIGDFLHMPYKIVNEMMAGEWSPFHDENKTLKEYMSRNYDWLVLSKVKHQIILGKPMIVR